MNKETKRNKVFLADNNWQHQLKMVDFKSFSIIYSVKGGFDSEEAASESYKFLLRLF